MYGPDKRVVQMAFVKAFTALPFIGQILKRYSVDLLSGMAYGRTT